MPGLFALVPWFWLLLDHAQLCHGTGETETESESDAASRRLILGGTPAAYDFFVHNALGPSGGCGGTLIHPDVALTAAHCRVVFEGRGLYVGPQMRNGTDGSFFEDARILIHPAFDNSDTATTLQNDLMLIQLQGVATQTPVTLNFDTGLPFSGNPVLAVGFGDTTMNGDPSDTLLETELEITDVSKCANYFWTKSQVEIREDLQICAIHEAGGRDACNGDSGGPLLIPGSDHLQVGVVGFGDGCGQTGVPGVYVRLSNYQDWIEEGICELSSQPPERCSATPAPQAAPTAAPLVGEANGVANSSSNDDPSSSAIAVAWKRALAATLLVVVALSS